MPISKGLITNSLLCLIPKVLVQCHVSGHVMTNSKGLPTLIRCMRFVNALALSGLETLKRLPIFFVNFTVVNALARAQF